MEQRYDCGVAFTFKRDPALWTHFKNNVKSEGRSLNTKKFSCHNILSAKHEVSHLVVQRINLFHRVCSQKASLASQIQEMGFPFIRRWLAHR